MNEEVSISLRYIEKKLFEDLAQLAKSKGLKTTKKKEIIEFCLNDYVQYCQDLENIDNPYLMNSVKSIIDSRCEQTEKNLGGRMTKVITETAVNQGILNRIVLDFLNKFGDNEETRQLLNKYRQESVEDLRLKQKPISYQQLLQQEDDS